MSESPTPRAGRRWWIGLLAVAAVPVILVGDLLIALARGWQSSSSMPDAILALFGTLLVGSIAIACSERGRRGYAKRAPALVGVVISTCLAWGAAEWVCGRVFGGQLLFHRHVPGTDAVFQPTPEVMPGVEGAARYTANSVGVRGPEMPDDPDEREEILCIGGSTTACLFLDDRETWTWLLSESLPTTDPPPWIGDVGKSGYGTWHHVQFLSKADDLLDRVDHLVLLIGINDFMRALQGRPIYAPPGVEPLYERSNLFAILHNLYQARKERKRHMQEFSDGSTYVRRRELRRARTITDELPDLRPWLADYRQNIAAIIDACRQRGIRPTFLTQPVLWSDAPTPAEEALCWLGETQHGEQLSTPQLAAGMRLFNEALRAECTEAGVDWIDLSSMNGDPRFFFDDCHFTELGARRVAEIVGPQLGAARD